MFGVLHMDGSGDDNPPLESLPSLYDELNTSAIIDGEVAVIHDETGWCLSAHRDGGVVFEKLGTRGTTARHMCPVVKQHTLELWRQLIDGNIDILLMEPWKSGYK